MYIKERKFKGFILHKKFETIVDKNIKKINNIFNYDTLTLIFWDNRWVVKSQTPTILPQWYFLRSNPYLDYVCCSSEHVLRGNFCKHQIVILLKFLLDCYESSMLEYCGTHYGTQRGGLEALCL